MRTGPMKQISTWISVDHAAELEALAKEADVSLSKLMARILKKAIAENNTQKERPVRNTNDNTAVEISTGEEN